MKKALLLIAAAAVTMNVNAQLNITASPYTQNFNSIGTGLPTGWSTYSLATASSVGTIKSFGTSTDYGRYADTLNCPSDVNGGGFKNFPSANLATAAMTCAEQKLVTDRAMGVKQVSQTNATNPNLEPGAAFVLKLAKTSGGTGFNLSFKLQSLDYTAPRVTTWVVDYFVGNTLGATDVFTPATATGTMTTGNLTFSNNPITVNFGTALDNKASNVWIRIVALTASTGSGSRAVTAIDDVNLTWTGSVGIADVASAPTTELKVIGNATSDKVSFVYSTEVSNNYGLSIYDITGRTIHTQTVKATAGENQLTVNGLNLTSGMYFARMSSNNSTTTVKFAVN
jgi:hypothetical protein